MNNLTVLTHTHTDCSDLWQPYFDSYDEFFTNNKHVVLINEKTEEIKNPQIIYDEKTPYVDRLILGLLNITTEFVLISFEDMILYDSVNDDELSRMIRIMESNDNVFYIRLIKSGIKSNINFLNKVFKLDKNDFLFSITPTVWSRKRLIDILVSYRGLSVWELESKLSVVMSNNYDLLTCLYYFEGEPKRGLNHHDSKIYPHICSAILKGKWNLSEYGNELKPIIEKYNIDVNLRGYV